MTTDEQQAKRIENLREEEMRRDEAALRYLIGDERGRWFLSRMLERCHVFSMAPGDASRILIFEGERNVGVELYSNLRMLAAIDETGQSLMNLQTAEREYGAFLARYERKGVDNNGGLL